MIFAQKSLCCYFGLGMTEWAGLVFLCSGRYGASAAPFLQLGKLGRMAIGRNASPQFLLPLAATQGRPQHTANMFFGGTIGVLCTQLSAGD